MKSNPFTATTTGDGFFYAPNGTRCDIELSGTGITTPFVVAGDVLVDDFSLATISPPHTVPFSANPTFDLSQFDWFQITLTGNVTGPAFSNSSSGSILIMTITQNAAGGHTFAWPASFLHPPTIATKPNAVTELSFKFDGLFWRQLAATGDNLEVSSDASIAGDLSVAGASALLGGGQLAGSFSGNPTITGNPTFSGNPTLSGSPTISGTPTFSGAVSFTSTIDSTGVTSLKNLGGIRFAEKFADVQAAINDLPAGGGIVYATHPSVNLALGTLDPGTKPCTLVMGPYSFTADHIVLQANFRIIGSASDDVSGAGTIVTSIGANAQPLIVNATSGLINVRGAYIEGVTFLGASGNTTQRGLSLDISANTTLSVIDSFNMTRVSFFNFKGNMIHLRGSLNTTTNASFIQFCKWDRVLSQRPASGGDALRLEGACGQFTLINCRFDGPAIGDGNNIYVGMTSNADVSLPYSLGFYDLTCQGSETGFTINGVNNLTVINPHHEAQHGAYLLQSTFTNSRNLGITFQGGFYPGNVGVNAGNGYILKSTTNFVGGVVLKDGMFGSTPDNIVLNTNGADIITQNNVYGQNNTPFKSTQIDFQTNPAASINLSHYHSVMVQAGGTAITTLNSGLGPGEHITFFANGTFSFATGGNINLGSQVTSLTLASGDTATFVNSDYSGSNVWRLVGTSSSTPKAVVMINTTGLSADVGSTLLYAVPASAGGTYRISGYAVVTQQATTSSTLPNVQATFTDSDTNVSGGTVSMTANSAGSPVNPPVGFNSQNALAATGLTGTSTINVKAGTNINYLTANYASVGATPMKFAIHVRLEYLG